MADNWEKIDNRRVRVDIKGVKALNDTLQAAYRMRGEVGILDDYEAASYMAEQEYGHMWKDVWVPARPWFRMTIVRMGERISKKIAKGLVELLAMRTQRPTFHLIEKVIISSSVMLQKGLKKTIQQHVPPPLSKITVKEKKKKGYATPETPLYATGRAYKGITYRIVKTNPK